MASEALNQRFIHIPFSALLWSLALHVLVPFIVVGIVAIENWEWKWRKKDIRQMYQDFVQVDVVALPDVMVSEKQIMDMSKPIVDRVRKSLEDPTEAAKQQEIALQKEKEVLAEKEKIMAEKAKKEKLEKQKADQEKALKKLQEDAKREQAMKALQQAKGEKVGREKLKNNKLATGVSATGKVGDMKEIWGARIQKAIKEHFNIFLWQQKKNLKNEVRIELYPNGRLKLRKVVKTSSDPTYDSAVLQAIDEVKVFPLPEDISLVSEPIIVEMMP